MVKNQWLLLLLLTCLTFKIQGQGGYFGKKTVISIDGSLRGTLIYNSLLNDFGYNNGNFNGKKSNHFIATGFCTSISHYFSKRAGIGLDFNMGFNYIKTPNELWVYGYYSDQFGTFLDAVTTVEKMRMKTIYIIPKFEWSSNGNLPIGLTNSIGIGYAGSSIVDDNYVQSARYTSYDMGETAVSKSTVKGSSIAPIHGLVFEYGIKIRFPIASFLTFNLGSNLRFHLPGVRYLVTGGANQTMEDQIRRSMRNSRGANIMDIRAGLSFILF